MTKLSNKQLSWFVKQLLNKCSKRCLWQVGNANKNVVISWMNWPWLMATGSRWLGTLFQTDGSKTRTLCNKSVWTMVLSLQVGLNDFSNWLISASYNTRQTQLYDRLLINHVSANACLVLQDDNWAIARAPGLLVHQVSRVTMCISTLWLLILALYKYSYLLTLLPHSFGGSRQILQIQINSTNWSGYAVPKAVLVRWPMNYNLQRIYLLLPIGLGHSNSSDHAHISFQSIYYQQDQTTCPTSCNTITLISQRYLNRCHVNTVMDAQCPPVI